MSIAGIKRIVFSALTEDANEEQQVISGLTTPDVNSDLSRGEMEMVPGVRREAGQQLLAQMGKTV
jgi:tRNA(adenine34) deaminase